MASGKVVVYILGSLTLATIITLNQVAFAVTWRQYVETEFDAANPNYIGNLLGPSEQQTLANFDEERKKVDDMISDGTSSGAIDATRGTKFKDELNEIAALQQKYMASGPISFMDAQGLLLKLNTLRANVQAVLKGK